MSEGSECIGFGEGEGDIRRKSSIEESLGISEVKSYEGTYLPIYNGSGMHLTKSDVGLARRGYHPELFYQKVVRSRCRK